MPLVVGEVYTGEQLSELCDEEEEGRYHVVVGRKAVAIVEDVGNDNYKVLYAQNPIDIFKELARKAQQG